MFVFILCWSLIFLTLIIAWFVTIVACPESSCKTTLRIPISAVRRINSVTKRFEQKIPKREIMSEHLQPTHTHLYDLLQASGDRKLGNGEIVELQIGGVERGLPPQTDEENPYAL
jgi:hypothetical protein